ncbi:MAG: hypothetical protein M3N68_11390 [Actinomycetota bacterium]|nr:hypothetical protein [Actinomycetota bacterium]
MKGDRVEILVDVGEGVRDFEILATRAGRRVEITSARGVVEVAEVTRSGQPVRSARFMTARVVAIVEHPAPERGESPPGRRSPAPAQPSLNLVED